MTGRNAIALDAIARADQRARMVEPKALGDHGRCCGRKPLIYKRPQHRLFCTRCDAAFDPATSEQVANWAYPNIRARLSGSRAEGQP